jgi:hypothetical protein
MSLIAPLFVFLFWFGPAAALLLVSLILEQQRHAPDGQVWIVRRRKA